MSERKYDIAIIGSGIGGLCTAALLAHSGFKVILLEKAPVLGGRYTSIRYKGFLVPTGASIIGHGYESPVWHTLEEVDAKRPEVLSINQFRYRIAGRSYDTFMDKKGGFKQLMEAAARDKGEDIRVLKALSRALRWQEPSDTITLGEWLSQYTENEQIHGVFDMLCSHMGGLHMHEQPAGAFMRVLKHEATHGGFLVPKNGLRDVVDSLKQAITRDGGEVLTLAGVTGITVEDDRVTGVVVHKRGEKTLIEAAAVVSNAGPVRTIDLAGESNFDNGYVKEVREKLRPSAGMAFVWESDQPLLDFNGNLYATDTKSALSWLDYSGIWPHWAPEGKHVSYMYAVPMNTPPYNPENMHNILLQDAYDIIPDLDKKGAKILLIHNYRGEWPWTRSAPGYMAGMKTSIQNLYNVGDAACAQGVPGGEGAAESGRIVAELIKNSINTGEAM